MADQERKLVWGKKVTKEFRQKVIDIATRLGADPDHLMAIMAFETGATFDPKQRNLRDPVNGPVGLIQFTTTGATAVGTTKAKLAEMDALTQLDYVEKFLAKKKEAGLAKIEDLYAAVHWPAATGKPIDHVLYTKQEGDAGRNYRSNAGLDLNNDGKVTLGEAAQKVKDKLLEGESYRNE